MPRDWAGSFTPRLIGTGQRRLDGPDDMIIRLYAGGMTVREIEHHVASTVGGELSLVTISALTDTVADTMLEWQNQPLDDFYPVVDLE